MPDKFLPDKDDAFASFFHQFATYATAGNPFNLPAALLTALHDHLTVCADQLENVQLKQLAAESAVAQKNTAFAVCRDLARQSNNFVQADPVIPDADKIAAGLPVHKTTRTATPTPETHPMLVKVDQEHLLHRLWFADETTPGSKGKPAGVKYCEIRCTFVAQGGVAPTNGDDMDFLSNDTRPPYRHDYDATEVGKTAYYALRWVNSTGEVGPWSVILGYLAT